MSGNSASSASSCRKRRKRGCRRLVSATGPEKDRDEKGNDRTEEYPPGKFHHGEPIGLFVEFRVEDIGDLVRQTTQDRDDDEGGDHGEDVAQIVPASAGEHPREKYTEQRSVGISENA